MIPSAAARTEVGNTSFSSGPMQPQLPSPNPTSSMNPNVVMVYPPAASQPIVTIAKPTALITENAVKLGRRPNQSLQNPNATYPNSDPIWSISSSHVTWPSDSPRDTRYVGSQIVLNQ